MNKSDLVSAMSEKSGLSKVDTDAALKAFVDVVSNELKNGGTVQIVGFGSFEVSERAARIGTNPQDGSKIEIAACKAPKFRAAKALKELVNS